MRCLVLGGAGFIGSHLVKQLVTKGHTVRVLDIKPNPYYSFPEGVECFWTDWNDSDAIQRAVTDMDSVVHLICTALPGFSNPGVITDLSCNLLPTLQLLQICLQNHVKKVVFLSSGGTVYGVPNYLPIDETHETYPISSYGIVKLMTEKYLHLFYHSYGLRYVILRGANIYGEYQNPTRPQGAVNVFLRRVAHSQPVEVWGDGHVVRDFLYVADIARAIQLALESDLNAEVLNVGSGEGTSLCHLLDIIQDVTQKDVIMKYLPNRVFDVPSNVLAAEKIGTMLGWHPDISLIDGIQRTWTWIQEVK